MKPSEAFTKTSFYARWLAEGHLSSWFFCESAWDELEHACQEHRIRGLIHHCTGRFLRTVGERQDVITVAWRIIMLFSLIRATVCSIWSVAASSFDVVDRARFRV
jgi:hypothetical protein